MIQKCLSLLLCLLAIMPQQICTCVWANDNCHADEATLIDECSDGDHDSDHQHPQPLLPEPTGPSHDHQPGCLATQPLQPTAVVKSISPLDVDVPVFGTQFSVQLMDTSLSRLLLNRSTLLFGHPHVSILVSQCSFQI